MKILLAVDDSPGSRQMLKRLAAQDVWLRKEHEYTVFHAVPAVPHPAAAFMKADEARALYDDDAESVLARYRTFFEQRGLPAAFAHEIGEASDLIARKARQGACDLIVMGSHGHGALGAMLLGSTTAKVLARCRIPVLVVR
ncbi:MAG: universal stress protein [Rhizobacter sp.]|nr:universal stress protein [Rhizobacter sp.]